MSQLEKMKQAIAAKRMAELDRPKPVPKPAPQKKQEPPKVKASKEPKPPLPEYLNLPLAPCKECGIDHPVPIDGAHWQWLKCKKKWVKKKHPPASKAERLDKKKLRYGRLPDGSVFHTSYCAEKQEWSGSLTVPGAPVIEMSFGGVFMLMVRLDRKYREWLDTQQPKQPT